MYHYAARVLRIIDADTVHLEIDLGFETFRRITVRLADIDAAELKTEAGQIARARLIEKLPPGTAVEVTTVRDRKDKWARYLARIILPGPPAESVNDWLVDQGLARPYPG